MTKIEILQLGALPEWDEVPLNQTYQVHRFFEMDDPDTFLKTSADQIRGIVTKGDVGAQASLINALPNLEVISIFGVGFDAVDIDLCRKRGIRVGNTPDVLTGDVADLAVAILLAQARNLASADTWVRSGDWAEKGPVPLARRMHGKRAGILGLGNIGRAIAQRLQAFDMEIAYCSRAEKDGVQDWRYVADPVSLAEWADFLIIALAANAETKKIVDSRVIDALGPEGTLVNVARGSVVDEAALLDALETKRLGFAALDVFEGEPAIDPRFADLDTVHLAPHIGSATTETRKAMGQLVRDNLESYFRTGELKASVV